MKFVLSLVLASRLLGVSHGAAVSSQLQVHIPHDLMKSGGYDHREALFGVPPYGGSIQQNVYYANSDLCDPNVDTRAGFPERPKDENGNQLPWPSPYILMVDRGGCTFVIKVRNAQRSGAAGVIIADNTCLCSAGDACISEPGVDCETQEPYMADDGSGSDISIPSFLMFKQDADPVKKVLTDNKMVRLEMAWALPQPDSRVEYELWTTPTDMISREFQRQFKDAAVALGKHAYFTPHMYIYDGVMSGCRMSDGTDLCYNLCTNDGRYCATDPDNDLDKGISGADVVTESLRRICIWKVYGETDGIGVPWWEYVNEFMFRCDKEEFFTNKQCITDAMKHAGVDPHRVQACMEDAGGLENDNTNALLESQLASKEASGVVIMPAAFVNNAAIRGALEFSTIFKAICAGYAAGFEPTVCNKCASCRDEYSCVETGHCSTAAAAGAVSSGVFAASMLILVLLFLCLGAIQYKRQQSSMQSEVRGILAQYMPLDKTNNKVQSAVDDDDEDDLQFTIS
mmetsp:Transcript_16742/g.23269  ORF Transcript_16742/g.23269 Transcript_16742/m.23269 type:complete len:513 (+) Transcript_16742:62-1600(+)